MKHMKAFAALALSMTMALSVSALAADKQVVKVGVSVPMTSSSEAESAENMVGGINAALEYAKDQGMVQNYELEMIIEDDGADPTKGMNTANKLVYNDGVKAMIGPVQSTIAAVTLPMLEEEGIPSIMAVASPALSENGYTYFFRANFTNAGACSEFMKYFVENLGYKNIGLLTAQNETCEVAMDCSLTYLKDNYDMEPADIQYFADTDTDFSAQLMSFKEKEVEGVAIFSGIVQGAQIVEQIRQLMGPDVFALGLSNGQTSYLELISAESANKSGYATGYDPCLEGEFYDTFREYYSHYVDRIAVDVSARGFDATMILITALDSMGEFDVEADDFGETLRDAIRNVEYTGAQGEFHYDEKGDGLASCNIIEYVDGERVKAN